MRYFILMLLFLVSCITPAANPTVAPENFGAQKFVNSCRQGYWDGERIAYKTLEGINPNACQTYTLINFKAAEGKQSRISGLNLELSRECATIDSVITDINTYERLLCSFDDDTDNVLNIYIKGQDIVIITEIIVSGNPVYFSPIGVEDEAN